MKDLFLAMGIVYIFIRLIIILGENRGGLNYNKARPQIIRMDEIRKDIDNIDDFLTDVDTVKRSNNIEIYAYIKYAPIAGGTDKTLRMPISTNADNLIVLAYGERQRLKDELQRAMNKLPRAKEND